MSNFGLKIAQPNKNANSQLPTDLVFSSLFSALPIFKIIPIEYSMAGFTTTRQNVRHGLNFVPFYLLFFKGSDNSDRYIWYPNSGAAILTSNNQTIILDRVDKDNITFSTQSTTSGTTIVKAVIIVFNFPIALAL